MKALEDIITELNRLIVGKMKHLLIAKVKSVDAYNCKAENDGIEYEARLSMQDENNAIIYKPTVGSYVLIAPIEGSDTDYAVIMYSAIDEIQLLSTEHKGLVKVTELVQKINALENAFNTLLAAYKVHTHGVVVPENAATSGDLIDPITAVSDLENEKIKH